MPAAFDRCDDGGQLDLQGAIMCNKHMQRHVAHIVCSGSPLSMSIMCCEAAAADHEQIVLDRQSKRSLAVAIPHARATVSPTIHNLSPNKNPKRSFAGTRLSSQVIKGRVEYVFMMLRSDLPLNMCMCCIQPTLPLAQLHYSPLPPPQCHTSHQSHDMPCDV
jgi:hypothetical protein